MKNEWKITSNIEHIRQRTRNNEKKEWKKKSSKSFFFFSLKSFTASSYQKQLPSFLAHKASGFLSISFFLVSLAHTHTHTLARYGVFHICTMTDGNFQVRGACFLLYVYSPVSDVICQLSVNCRGKRERDIINIGATSRLYIVSFKLSCRRA